VKVGGEINAKYPGGTAEQKKRLGAEGHCIVKKGKKYVVVDYQSSLVNS